VTYYKPGDGHNRGLLACGGKFTDEQVHIAHRKWWKWGCGRSVRVCSLDTNRCVVAPIMDGGPYGMITGSLRNAKKEGRWKVQPKADRLASRSPPPGWRFRGIADLSYGLWLKLGKPKGLSRVRLYFLPRRGKTANAEGPGKAESR
jgi:hypothetical protein